MSEAEKKFLHDISNAVTLTILSLEAGDVLTALGSAKRTRDILLEWKKAHYANQSEN
jgi:hypothetical protein